MKFTQVHSFIQLLLTYRNLIENPIRDQNISKVNLYMIFKCLADHKLSAVFIYKEVVCNNSLS
jgi:hypothetical protein